MGVESEIIILVVWYKRKRKERKIKKLKIKEC